MISNYWNLNLQRPKIHIFNLNFGAFFLSIFLQDSKRLVFSRFPAVGFRVCLFFAGKLLQQWKSGDFRQKIPSENPLIHQWVKSPKTHHQHNISKKHTTSYWIQWSSLYLLTPGFWVSACEIFADKWNVNSSRFGRIPFHQETHYSEANRSLYPLPLLSSLFLKKKPLHAMSEFQQIASQLPNIVSNVFHVDIIHTWSTSQMLSARLRSRDNKETHLQGAGSKSTTEKKHETPIMDGGYLIFWSLFFSFPGCNHFFFGLQLIHPQIGGIGLIDWR